MSNCQKDVKWSKDVKYQKVKHMDYGGGSQKINSHNEVHTFLMSILMSNIKVTKIGQKYFLCTF